MYRYTKTKYRNHDGTLASHPLKDWSKAASYTKANRSEAQVVAEIYHQCRKRDVPVRLELTTSLGRLDAVILGVNMNVVAIIEAKRDKIGVRNQDQSERYSAFGLPLYWISSTAEAIETIPLIIKRHKDDRGIPLSEMAEFEVTPLDELQENLNIRTGDNAGYRKQVY